MFIQDYAITEICEVEMSLLLDSCHCLSRRFPGFERVELTFHPPTPRFRPILAILKFVITRNEETVPRVVVEGIRYMREHLCHVQEAAFITGLLPVFKVTNMDHEFKIHLVLVQLAKLLVETIAVSFPVRN